MKIRSTAYWMMGIGCLMIFSGCVSSIIIGLREDRLSVLNRETSLHNEFEDFSTNVTVFELKRDTFYNETLNVINMDNIYTDDIAIKNKLSNYESIINEIDKKVGMLDNLCNDMYYPDTMSNSICTNYRSIYEQVVNYFVTDINLYNKKVDEYNNSVKLSGNGVYINKYNTNKDFIDYNNDLRFDGRD